MSAGEGEIIDAWPLCPQCKSPRIADCLLCGAAKDYFPPAYQQPEEEHSLRFCPGCDDVAELRFYRRCHECGHDFGEGHEPQLLPRSENEARAWAVLVIMLGGSLLLLGYFYWLFRR